MTPAQFDDKLAHKTVAGDTRYTVTFPTASVAGVAGERFNAFQWARNLSSIVGGENFTAMTFTGTGVLLVANKVRFDADVAALTPAGVEVV